MKILLVVPDFPILREDFSPENYPPPLGINYICAKLRNNNHDVVVIDTLMTYLMFSDIDPINISNGVERLIKDKYFHIVGITVLSHTINIVINIAKKIKSIVPNIKIVLGGPHSTVMWEQILKNYSDFVDFIILGEGEDAFVDLAKCLMNNVDPCNVPNIVYNKKTNNLNQTFSTCSLDDVLFPDYSHYMEYLNKLDTVSVLMSRGCPVTSCPYCFSTWTKYRERSITNVVNEIEFLATKYDTRIMHFHDNMFTFNKNHTIELLEDIINRNLSINLSVKTRFDSVDKEILCLLKKAGGKTISLGLESGSEKLRLKMGKKFDNEYVKNVSKFIKSIGLSLGLYILLGYPDETEEDIKQTIELLETIQPDEVMTNITTLYPGTRLYQQAKLKKIICDDDWLSDRIFFTYIKGDKLLKVMEYETIINKMFPRILEWKEYNYFYKQ